MVLKMILNRPQALRKKLGKSQNWICYYCDCRMLKMLLSEAKTPDEYNRVATFEHLHKIADGGCDSEDNIVLACSSCNSHRQDISPELWRIICKDIIALRTRKKDLYKRFTQSKLSKKQRNKKVKKALRVYYRFRERWFIKSITGGSIWNMSTS